MAQGKKSFLLYCDLIHTIEKLPNEKAGELFKIILQYVNDKDPIVDDLILQISFEPIKQALKRDLVKYSEFIEKQSFNGSKGGRPKKPKESQKTQAFLEKPKKADSVNDSVSVIKDISQTTLIDCEKLFLEKTAFNWTEQYAKKEAEKFYNFYSAKGWLIGKNKMKSLTHAIGGWITRQDKPEIINAPVDRNKTEKIIFY